MGKGVSSRQKTKDTCSQPRSLHIKDDWSYLERKGVLSWITSSKGAPRVGSRWTGYSGHSLALELIAEHDDRDGKTVPRVGSGACAGQELELDFRKNVVLPLALVFGPGSLDVPRVPIYVVSWEVRLLFCFNSVLLECLSI